MGIKEAYRREQSWERGTEKLQCKPTMNLGPGIAQPREVCGIIDTTTIL